MSSKDYCPRADCSKYEANSFFVGSIVSSYSKLNRLAYCVATEDVYKFLMIDDYKYYKKMSKKPGVGAFFVYYSSSRNSYYRGYNLGANPVEPLAIKAFFFDTGEVHYLTFDKTKFFYLPEALYMPVMGMFCKIKSFPKKFKTILDFFDQCALKKLKFNICEKGTAKNELGDKEECLFVDVEFYRKKTDSDDDEEDAKSIQEEGESNSESSNVVKLTKSALLKFDSENEPPTELTYNDGPFMSSELPSNSDEFQPNQKIIVYPQMTLAANLYYGACKNIHEAGCDSKELTRLMIFMNKFNVKYEKLNRKPLLNEMVIMFEDTKDKERYYRGMVLEIIDEICMILYVDYGKIQPFHYTKLIKFPIEFSSVPFHTFRIHASNIQISTNEVLNHTNMIIVDITIKPMCFGIVEKSDGFDVIVKLFDMNGRNMTYVLERMHKPLRVPQVSKKVKKSAEDEQSRE